MLATQLRSPELLLPSGWQAFERKHECQPRNVSADPPPFVRDSAFAALIQQTTRNGAEPAVLTVVGNRRWQASGPEERSIIGQFACRVAAARMTVIAVATTAHVVTQEYAPALRFVHLPTLGERIAEYLFDTPAHRPYRDSAWGPVVYKLPAVLSALESGAERVLYTDVDIAWLQSPLPYFQNFRAGFAAARDPDDLVTPGVWQAEYEREGAREDVSACCRGAFGVNAGLLFADRLLGRAVLERALVGLRHVIALNARRHPAEGLRCHEDQNPLGWAAATLCTEVRGGAAHRFGAGARCQRLKPRLFMGVYVFLTMFNGTDETRAAARTMYRRRKPPMAVHVDSDDKSELLDLVAREFGRCDVARGGRRLSPHRFSWAGSAPDPLDFLPCTVRTRW
jgi:hypothetical protein